MGTEIIANLLYILIPASAVLGGMFLVVRSFMNREFQQALIENKDKNREVTLPLRLQAYERMALYLERNSINSLIRRLSDPAYRVMELQELLLTSVREEFNHNLSQQIYVSSEAWEYVRSAMEETISLINNAAQDLDKTAPGSELSRKIFELAISRETDQTEQALRFLKEEAQSNLF